MKKISLFVIIGLLFFGVEELRSQVQIDKDPAFGTGGTFEVNVGGFDNEATAFDASKAQPTTVCGRISTATPGMYRLGIIRVDTVGKLDQKFGTGGIVNLIWGASDYPLDMKFVDSTIILSGVTGSTPDEKIPAMYRFKKNGTPDSSFGINGRLIASFDDHSAGEGDNIFGDLQGYVICGRSRANDAEGKSGFAVIRFTRKGKVDSSFGSNGRIIIPALVHSEHGFFLNDRNILFCGVSDTGKPEILVGRITYKGVIDSAYGINGLNHTGIFLTNGNTIMARTQTIDDRVVILLPAPDSSPTPITICRFTPDGKLDSTYGNSGIGRNLISPSFQQRGFNTASDGSSVVSGLANVGLGISITMRLNDTTAVPDPRYLPNGIAVLDVDNGAYTNYLNFVAPVGKISPVGGIRRYIGVGGSVHSGITYFMIMRFLTLPPNSARDNPIIKDATISIYPDPVTSSFKIEASGDGIKNIRVVDVLGREVLHLGAENYFDYTKVFSANASNIPDGLYYCIAQSGAQQVVRKFVVAH